MKIRYQSRHGLPDVAIVSFVDDADVDLKFWRNGQERDVDDKRMVRFRLSLSSSEVTNVRAVDALLDSGPDFVDAATGVNPDFACAVCGAEELSEFFHDVDGNRIKVAEQGGQGRRLCIVHFLVAYPKYIAQFVAAGLPSDIRQDVESAIRDGATPQAKPPVSVRPSAPVQPQAPAEPAPDQAKG